MWIRTTTGNYVNVDRVVKFTVSVSKLGGYNISAQLEHDVAFVARFETQAQAQQYLDALSRTFDRVIDANMTDWHYTGHEKDRKEKRHGGS